MFATSSRTLFAAATIASTLSSTLAIPLTPAASYDVEAREALDNELQARNWKAIAGAVVGAVGGYVVGKKMGGSSHSNSNSNSNSYSNSNPQPDPSQQQQQQMRREFNELAESYAREVEADWAIAARELREKFTRDYQENYLAARDYEGIDYYYM